MAIKRKSNKKFEFDINLEDPVGFEPTIRELQSHALPLGYGSIKKYLVHKLHFTLN